MAVVGSAITVANQQNCRTVIASLLKQYFAATLNTEKDIVNLVMAQIQAESSFNITASFGPQINPLQSSGCRDYLNSGPIKNVLQAGSGTQQFANAYQGTQAWGCLQSMGWNHVKGASLANGKCLVEQARPDLVSQLCINPGESLQAKFNKSSTLTVQILAGLVILENKYKSVKKLSSGLYSAGGPQYAYSDKMSATFQAYIGLSQKDAGNQSQTSKYVGTIMYGSDYKLANGSSGVSFVGNQGQQNAIANGPVIGIASGDNQHPVGC